MNTNKKILLGAGIVTLLIVIGGFSYVLTHKQAPTTAQIGSGSPFGEGGDADLRPTETTSPESGTIASQIKTVNALRQISETAVSGSTFVPAVSTTTPELVAFVERSTGHIFTANLETNTVTRLTNTTIPKVHSVLWGTSGKTAIFRSLLNDTIQTESVRETVSTSTGETSLSESQLLPNILTLALSPKEDKIFYILRGTLGAEGYVSDLKGSNATGVFQFPTDEWSAEWGSGDTVLLTSNPSNGDGGYLYSINTKTKTEELLLSDIAGLQTKASPSGKKIFYSSVTGPALSSFVYDTASKTSAPLQVKALASKCAWNNNESAIYCGVTRKLSSNAPEDWFQGLVSYDDDIYRLDLEDGGTSKIATLITAEEGGIDVLQPVVSSDEKTLVFMNKKDLSLWSADLSQ